MPSNLEPAIASHKAGRLEAAALLYQKALDANGSHAPALHLLGVLRHQQGDDGSAIELLTKSLALEPNLPEVHANLADAYRAQGRLHRAVGSSRLALKLWPDCPEALCNLGLALHAQGKRDEALEPLRRALELRPDLAPAHNILGLILRETGQLDEAIGHFRRAVELEPASVPAINNLSQVLIEQGLAAEALPHCDKAAARRTRDRGGAPHPRQRGSGPSSASVEARAAYLEALRLDPEMPSAYAQVGLTLLGELRPGEALPWMRQALAIDSLNALFHEWLGRLYIEWDEPDLAIPCFEQAVALGLTDRLPLRFALAQAFVDAGRLEQAREQIDIARRLAPAAAEVELQLGDLYQTSGKLAEAEAAFRAAMKIQPGAAAPIARLAAQLGGRLPANDFAVLEERLGDVELDSYRRARLLFAKARVLDERGAFGLAAECAREANSLAHQSARGWRIYDPAAGREFVDALVAAVGAEFVSRTAGHGHDTRQPVFVFGLPRSGTTLIQQVLSAHSRVAGGGELRISKHSFQSIPHVLGRPGAPLERIGELDGAAVIKLAEQYLAWLADLDCGAAERIVDKMPANYLYLGLLATLFPRATFIHCRRDLRDVAVSCWMTDFRMITWANHVGHVGDHFRSYLRLMEHWREVLPVPICEVDYEDVVNDLEEVAHRLIDACGLEWEAECVEFHKSQRPVRTASVIQVRQPIYHTSVGRWRNYQHFLAELFASLPQPERDREIAVTPVACAANPAGAMGTQ